MKRIRPLDTRQLQAFEHLCQTGSFTRTAKQLLVTQSAVSHSLRSLEKEAGCKLIKKQGKQIRLTEAGERLLAFARPWLEEMNRVRDEIRSSDDQGVPRIRLGASDQICRFLLPPLLKEFSNLEPRCKFEIRGLDTLDCLNLLSSNEVDLSLTVEPFPRSDYLFIPCFSDELVVVTYPEHSWAKKGIVCWRDINGEKFILPNRRGFTFRAIHDFLSNKGIQLNSFMEMNSSETTKELIKHKFGIGILADWFVAKEVESGELVSLPLGPRRLIRPWGISTLKSHSLGTAERAFIKCVEQMGCLWMVNRDPSFKVKLPGN